MLFTFVILVVLFASGLAYNAPPTAGNWWNMGFSNKGRKSGGGGVVSNPSYMLAPKPLCLSMQGLSMSQARLCEKYVDHMPVISIGANMGIRECQNQFKYRHWNCTTLGYISGFGPEIIKGSREAGFSYAISAAGVVHALARGCKAAVLGACSCSEADRPEQLHHDWIWGGCGDNIRYAYKFAKHFIDIREKEKSHPRGSAELAGMLMNLHNNRAGRLSVYKLSSVACKCHGISASCSLRTCWTQLSPFNRIGSFLLDRYDSAIQVKFNGFGTKLRRKRGSPKPLPEDLVYIEDSHDFCSLDPLTGDTGTTGRECLPDGRGKESCHVLCCGRGFRTLTREVRDKCHCRFHWCCKVECQTCVRYEQYHLCN